MKTVNLRQLVSCSLKVKLFDSCSDLGAVAAHTNSSKWKIQIKISPFLDEVCSRYPLSSSHMFLEPFVIPLDCSSWEAGLASISSRCPVSLHRPFVIWDWKSTERSDSARYEEHLNAANVCMHYWTHRQQLMEIPVNANSHLKMN